MAKVFAERMFSQPAYTDYFATLTKQQYNTLFEAVVKHVDEIMASGKPVEFETLVVVARKE